MTNSEKRLRAFLCHSSSDKDFVESFYDLLVSDGIDPWFDKKKLLPGQDWQMEIPKAVRNSDVVIVFLSKQSITKEGYVQKEIKIALDTADEKPDGTIFIVPARVENCKVPDRLEKYQWVDLFENDGYKRLLKALKLRADSLGIKVETRKKEIIFTGKTRVELAEILEKIKYETGDFRSRLVNIKQGMNESAHRQSIAETQYFNDNIPTEYDPDYYNDLAKERNKNTLLLLQSESQRISNLFRSILDDNITSILQRTGLWEKLEECTSTIDYISRDLTNQKYLYVQDEWIEDLQYAEKWLIQLSAKVDAWKIFEEDE